MRGIPYNEELENSLIVGILQDPSIYPKVSEIINFKDFYKFSNQEIFKVIATTPVDEIDSLTIHDKLSKDSVEHFEKLVRDGDLILPSLSNILVYAEDIKSKAILRDCVRMGQEITSLGYQDGITSEEAYTDLEAKLATFLQRRVHENRDESTQEAFGSFLDNLGQRVNRDGVKTGFFAIDMMLQRLEGLTILAARPSMGKTAMAINIIRNVAVHKNVLFFSLEQSREQVFERFLSSEAGVSLEDIRSGAFIADKLSVDKINDVKPTMLDLMSRIHVDQRPRLSSAHIASTSRQKMVEWGHVGLIVVDYLHIMQLNDRARVESLGDAVGELRALGKELETPVILLSQLSRQPENATNEENKKTRRRPEMSDLRGSGEIEQIADCILFLFRESYYRNEKPDEDQIEIIVSKQRNGRVGTVMLDWFPKYQRFMDQI